MLTSVSGRVDKGDFLGDAKEETVVCGNLALPRQGREESGKDQEARRGHAPHMEATRRHMHVLTGSGEFHIPAKKRLLYLSAPDRWA